MSAALFTTMRLRRGWGARGQLKCRHPAHGQPNHVCRDRVPFSQEHRYVPRKLCNRVRAVASFGTPVSTKVDPKYTVVLGEVIGLCGPVAAARPETVDEKERFASSPLGVVEPRIVDDAIRHGLICPSETARGDVFPLRNGCLLHPAAQGVQPSMQS